MTPTLAISRLLVLLTTGLLTGILLGDRVGMTPVRPLLPPGSFIQLQQGVHVAFVPLMPVLMILSVLAGGAIIVHQRRQLRSLPVLLTALGTGSIALVFILTRLFNVPVNDQLMTWQASLPPHNLMTLWDPWEHSHAVRTIFAVLGFASHCSAVVLASRTDHPVRH